MSMTNKPTEEPESGVLRDGPVPSDQIPGYEAMVRASKKFVKANAEEYPELKEAMGDHAQIELFFFIVNPETGTTSCVHVGQADKDQRARLLMSELGQTVGGHIIPLPLNPEMLGGLLQEITGGSLGGSTEEVAKNLSAQMREWESPPDMSDSWRDA